MALRITYFTKYPITGADNFLSKTNKTQWNGLWQFQPEDTRHLMRLQHFPSGCGIRTELWSVCFPAGSVVRTRLPMQETDSTPALERSPGEGNGNPLQHSCLENPMDRGALWATVHEVAKESDTTQRLNNDKMVNKWCCVSPELQSTGIKTRM